MDKHVVPSIDLSLNDFAGYHPMADAFLDVIDAGSFILGDQVDEFAEEWAEYLSVKRCVPVGSGFDALQLLLRHYVPDTRDNHLCEVIVPNIAPLPTWMAVSAVGATPVAYDMYNHQSPLDVVTEYTVAIILVHLYGFVWDDIDRTVEQAKEMVIPVIEDCAQAHGAEYNGRKVGGFGNASAWSFYPTKNLGCLGDGGAVTTNDGALAKKIEQMRCYGGEEYVGINSRMDTMQAAFLLEALKKLDENNRKRDYIAGLYDNRIKHKRNKKVTPRDTDDFTTKPVWHQYVITNPNRGLLKDYFASKGIQTQIHYPKPCHAMPVYSGRRTNQITYAAEEWANSVLSLPIAPHLTDENVEHVIRSANEYLCNERI